MRSGRNLFALSMMLLAALLLITCAGQTEEEDNAAAQAEQWAAVQQAKADLEAKRQELKAMKEQLGAAPEEGQDAAPEEGEGDGAEGAEGEAAPSPAEQYEAFKEDVAMLGEEFNNQLAEFINSQDIFEGEELTDVQKQAFDLKAQEDILVAQEYIDEGGNYQKAIDIYTTALLYAPGNERLLAAQASAEELRYMTEERFSQVKKDMTREEVRGLLGIPKSSNIREFEKDVIGWFYPKEEPRTAAGIYFREKKGEYRVYTAEYDAIKAEDASGG